MSNLLSHGKLEVAVKRRNVVCGLVAVFMMIGIAGSEAQAQIHAFCGNPSVIPANSRCIDKDRHWLYGVGVSNAGWNGGPIYVCVGAKTNSDGSGGDAIPFRCDYVEVGTIWTAGGNSKYGWGTIINRNGFGVWAPGVVNYRD